MMDANEIKARIEATRAITVEVCPRCGRDNCSCFTSGEFFELQAKLRGAEAELKQLRAELEETRRRRDQLDDRLDAVCVQRNDLAGMLGIARRERVDAQEAHRRDRSQPFTTQELERIEDTAKACDDQLVEQMAGVLLDTERHFEKEADVLREFASQVRGLLALVSATGRYEPDSIMGGAISRVREFAEGVAREKVPETELAGIHWEHGTPFRVQFKTNWAMLVMAASISEMFHKPDGNLWNYISCQMHYAGETYEVMVQRKSGETAKQQLDTMTALAVQLAEQLDKQRKWNEKPRIDFCDADNDDFEVDLEEAAAILESARKAGLIK